MFYIPEGVGVSGTKGFLKRVLSPNEVFIIIVNPKLQQVTCTPAFEKYKSSDLKTQTHTNLVYVLSLLLNI